MTKPVNKGACVLEPVCRRRAASWTHWTWYEQEKQHMLYEATKVEALVIVAHLSYLKKSCWSWKYLDKN